MPTYYPTAHRARFRGSVSGKPQTRGEWVQITLKSGTTKVYVCIPEPHIKQILHKDYLEASGRLWLRAGANEYQEQADGFILAEKIKRINRYDNGEVFIEERVVFDLEKHFSEPKPVDLFDFDFSKEDRP